MKLSDASKIFKRSLNIFIIFVIFYYVYTLFLAPFGYKIFVTIFPPHDLPTLALGKLSPLEFFARPILNDNPTITLNTKSGELPTNLPNKMYVFGFKPAQFSYQAGKQAKDDAMFLGFTDNDLTTDLRTSKYQWRSLDSGGVLEIETSTNQLLLNTNLAGKDRVFTPGMLTQTDAITTAKSMFASIGRLGDSLYAKGEQTVKLGVITQDGVLETQVVSEAHVAKVDFFRYATVGEIKYPILGPDAKKGLLSAVVRKPADSNARPYYNYPIISFSYWEIDPQINGTYPIIPVRNAWDAVRLGKGVISSVSPRDQSPFSTYRPVRIDRILINDVYLAYYESPKYQRYMQPMYVFEGNYTSVGTSGGNVVLYFPALSGENVNIPVETPVTK